MCLGHGSLQTQGQVNVVFSSSQRTWRRQEVLVDTPHVCLCTTAICDLFALVSDRSENNCYLYGVFNGYDGNRVTNFVGQRLSAELLLGQLHADHSDADVRRVLLQVKRLGPGTAPASHTTHLLFLPPGEQHLVSEGLGNICQWL